MKVILDTNFLLIPGSLGVDIFSELTRICDFKFEICVVDKTLDELDGIIAKGGKASRDAKLGFSLIKNKGVKTIKTSKEGTVDDLLVDISKMAKIIVATQDKELKVRLKPNVVGIISLRQKKYLKLEIFRNLYK